ncbi:DUF2179 domain-containing protein [Adhaeretor mobilis]|uniref:UPF0316 protein HG15A2_28720 n=1 Tax=Adhaeretor mobilis TaxID=1930276 RepID=A0A517MXD8_9BACT|nr:DUF5698 domain-containing protein [Adhaeretor mobilis]QDS99548.1 hypothetical protein HG15A2_28720 [Adhaeretor mobilis]
MDGWGMLISSAVLIFALRVVDVSLGALRISMLFRGRRGLAGLFGFFESLVWLIAAALVLGNLSSPIQFVAYACGYAAGTMLGSTMEKWLAIGDALVRIVTPSGSPELTSLMRDAGYYMTTVDAKGRDGDVQVSLSVVPRRAAPRLMTMARNANPEAFITYEETTPFRLATMPAVSVRK